jgi:hypothetical protein
MPGRAVDRRAGLVHRSTYLEDLGTGSATELVERHRKAIVSFGRKTERSGRLAVGAGVVEGLRGGGGLEVVRPWNRDRKNA